ncbi:TolB family protein [Streptomyces sp. NPDC020731]|uniref:TolB family protein n=1 Tax=Streptomyces sp. NPDC020731 TaxID=3365085 RepID=UPI003795A19C
METAGSGGRYRLGRLGMSLLLLAPLLGVTAAAGPGSAEPRTTAAADTAQTRIVYAGTGHRSLGEVATTTSSTALFDASPVHYDMQPSALGDQLVFASRRDEKNPQIYLRAADGSVERLTIGMDAAHPQLTYDGRFVVFDAAEPAAGGGTQRDLWRVRTDGTGLTRLTDTPADEEDPTVSPDGQRIAYAADSGPSAGRQIYVRDLDGDTATRITDPANGTASEPAWNPVDDGANRDWIAYTVTTTENGRSVRRLRITNGTVDEPLFGGARATWRAHGAAWLPDGDGLVFLSPETTCECEGDWDHVFRSTAHSDRVPSLVLNENRDVLSPTWLGSLDGGGAVVERTSAAGPHTVTLQDVRSDGSDPRDLGLTILEEDPEADTNTDPAKDPLFEPRPGYDPWTERQSYTPDGRRIVVTRFETNAEGRRKQRIWLVDADGSNEAPMKLAGRADTDWDTDPAFSPDGKYLAFTRTSPGGVGGAGRILVADVATGAITGEVVPPDGELTGRDAQPTWSPDGTTLAFTRSMEINGAGGNKHVWTVLVDDPPQQTDPPQQIDLSQQTDLSAENCPGDCEVIDDSPAFSPDGRGIAFNRKNGAGRVDEENGILLTSPSGGTCRVLLPAAARGVPGACGRELPDTSVTGPHQPRDAAWTADGKGLVFSSRAGAAVNSPEKLSILDVASGGITALTGELAGRQKEPSVQQSVDLAVRAPGTVPQVTVGDTTTVTVDVVDKGPAASPGTLLTIAPSAGVQVTRISRPGGTCVAASLQCDLGVVEPGTTVPVEVTLTGLVPGDAPVDWSVTGTVIDPLPSDNAGRTVVPVAEATPPPTPTPTPTPVPPAPPTPMPPPPPAPTPTAPSEPEEPEAGPGVRVTAQPNPGYVGGRVVVTYTVRNGRNALATGLRLRVGLPAGIPGSGPPAGCDRNWVCALPDLTPGASTVVRVVLSPDKATTGQVTGVLTTTGTDADKSDNTARQRLRVLQPRIVAVPEIGKPGFVTSVRGKDFPPGVPVRFKWKPGITAAAAPTVPLANGTFTGQLLILAKDQTGPRVITARGPGFSPVKTDFLVVNGSVQPPDEVTRR